MVQFEQKKQFKFTILINRKKIEQEKNSSVFLKEV